jgi:tetratricopeptide (TPR) repeat protein
MTDPCKFVRSVKPLLEAKDLKGLLCYLKENYTADQITELLSSSDCDARKVAALALSLVGKKCCIPLVAERLKDTDTVTSQLAEHALWCIWFRCGTPAANDHLALGARCLSDRAFDCAFEHFDKAIELSPDFAEVYNQRAIAHFLREDYERSMEDCSKTVALMPCHFGAWAGLGHCHAHMGNVAEAIRAYEKALEFHPHLDGIRQALCELHKRR